MKSLTISRPLGCVLPSANDKHTHAFNSLFATFADLYSYTHAYCSFVLLNMKRLPLCLGLHSLLAILFAFLEFSIQFTGKKIQLVEHSTSKCRPNSNVPQNNVARGGFVNKELKHPLPIKATQGDYFISPPNASLDL